MNALDQAIWDTRVKEAVESRKEGAVSNKNLAIIAADNEIKRLTDENAALEAEVKFLVEEEKCTESEFEKMEDEYAVIIRELREQLREARDKGSDV